MKKIICACIIFMLVMSWALFVVRAESKDKKMLLLGDSITYGYGLLDGPLSPQSYGMLLKEHFGIDDENFKNAAVNGYTSEDLLAQLPTLHEYISDADVIVVSIGGNDLLGILPNVSELAGEEFSGFEHLLEKYTDPLYIYELLNLLTFGAIKDAVLDYYDNLYETINYIRELNPDTALVFLAQYNPISGVEELDILSDIAAGAIVLLNAAMKQAAAGVAAYIDCHSHFEGRAPELTFIMAGDIHPNADGHLMLFELVAEHLDKESLRLPDDGQGAEETGRGVLDKAVDAAGDSGETSISATSTHLDENTTDVTDTVYFEPEDGDKKKQRGCRSALGYPLGAFWLSLLMVAYFIFKNKERGNAGGS